MAPQRVDRLLPPLFSGFISPAQDFFADVSKELCDLTEEEMGRMEKEELQRQIYMAAYETYALDRVRDQV